MIAAAGLVFGSLSAANALPFSHGPGPVRRPAGGQGQGRGGVRHRRHPAQHLRLRDRRAVRLHLTSAGYAAPQAGHLFLKPATLPSYLHCVNPAACTTTEYKSGTRKYISSLGYSIVADFGDQYSDLIGGDAGHQVKIPDPMYYIS